MSEIELEKIAEKANIIVAGYAYILEDGQVKVLNLNNPKEACVLSLDGEMLSTNTDEVTLSLVQAYYQKNKQFMEENDA